MRKNSQDCFTCRTFWIWGKGFPFGWNALMISLKITECTKRRYWAGWCKELEATCKFANLQIYMSICQLSFVELSNWPNCQNLVSPNKYGQFSHWSIWSINCPNCPLYHAHHHPKCIAHRQNATTCAPHDKTGFLNYCRGNEVRAAEHVCLDGGDCAGRHQIGVKTIVMFFLFF